VFRCSPTKRSKVWTLNHFCCYRMRPIGKRITNSAAVGDFIFVLLDCYERTRHHIYLPLTWIIIVTKNPKCRNHSFPVTAPDRPSLAHPCTAAVYSCRYVDEIIIYYFMRKKNRILYSASIRTLYYDDVIIFSASLYIILCTRAHEAVSKPPENRFARPRQSRYYIAMVYRRCTVSFRQFRSAGFRSAAPPAPSPAPTCIIIVHPHRYYC